MKENYRVYMIDNPEAKKTLKERTISSIPHTKELGINILELDRNKAVGKLSYQEQLVGNTETGALHTGALLSLFDSIAGLSVFCALPDFEMIATLDLRLDYYKPSSVNTDLYFSAECHHLTNTVAFVMGTIYHESATDPVAGCVATFFRSGKRNKESTKNGEPT